MAQLKDRIRDARERIRAFGKLFAYMENDFVMFEETNGQQPSPIVIEVHLRIIDELRQPHMNEISPTDTKKLTVGKTEGEEE